MKTKSLLFLLLLSPVLALCQTVEMPAVRFSEDRSTIIAKVEVTNANTVVTFRHTSPKGGWVQLNKSIYLQNADGEDRYNYVRSEGIVLRPAKFTATEDDQIVEFKVYFEKLKAGTKAINVIERALSPLEREQGAVFFNYYYVSLNASEHQVTKNVTIVDTVLTEPHQQNFKVNDTEASFMPMITNMYASMLDAQLKMFSNPAIIDKLASANKKYYDALMKTGFSEDQALKILVSKPLISTELGGKQ